KPLQVVAGDLGIQIVGPAIGVERAGNTTGMNADADLRPASQQPCGDASVDVPAQRIRRRDGFSQRGGRWPRILEDHGQAVTRSRSLERSTSTIRAPASPAPNGA